MAGLLGGTKVIDLTSTITGAQVTQTLADFGADVTMVERPGGNPLRGQPAWPFWARGKRSVELDLTRNDDRDVVRAIAADADVVVETWRPGVSERFGVGYDDLAALNRRLVYASVTGFGRNNPLSNVKGYEAIVMAKIGALDSFAMLSNRPGPSFVGTPYGSFTASQLCLHGILAALVERETSGLGQRVETTLAQGVLAHDTWNWLVRLLTKRYSEAFSASAPVSGGGGGAAPRINSALFLRLLVGFSSDGKYMQFSQMSNRLWEAFLRATGVGALLEDMDFMEGHKSLEEAPHLLGKFQAAAVEITRSKTYDEWLAIFNEEPDVWAEMFRDGSELLHHPQLVHDGRTIVIDDPAVGPVRQPGPLVQLMGTPVELVTPAPALDSDGAAIRAATAGANANLAVSKVVRSETLPTTPPLAGITILEFGTFFAAPFGATLLTDLGARVIKLEQLDGDPIRTQIPFPEVGGVKVLQGKQSVAVDIGSEEGKAIVYELVRKADVVLQSFRAGVAERHGYTPEALFKINPELLYVNAPGYGVGPPYGQRPAFAPTIGAASGMAYRNVGGRENIPDDPSLTLPEVLMNATKLGVSMLSVGQADGFSAAGVATALMLGILARKRGLPAQEMRTSMLSTMAHCLSEDMVEYEGRATLRRPDKDLHGLGARYRLYETAEGWVFLAAPSQKEWIALADHLGLPVDLASDEDALTAELTKAFLGATAAEWEARLTAADVACAAAVAGPPEEVVFYGGGLGEQMGILAETTHPIFETYPRLAPTIRMSRSEGVVGPAPMCGSETAKVLAEIGYTEEQMADLETRGVILTN